MKCMNGWNLLQVKNKDTSDVIDVVLLSLLYILRIWKGIPHSGDSQKYFLKKATKTILILETCHYLLFNFKHVYFCYVATQLLPWNIFWNSLLGVFSYWIIRKWPKFGPPPFPLARSFSIFGIPHPPPQTFKALFQIFPTTAASTTPQKFSSFCDFIVFEPPVVISPCKFHKKCSAEFSSCSTQHKWY